MVSIKDVAREAGVSVSTVSRVIRKTGYVSQEKRENIEKVIEKLNYRPNAMARSLVGQQSHAIGLVVSTIQSPFLIGLLSASEEIARKNGFIIFVQHTHENPEMERDAVNKLLDWRVDGILSCPSKGCDPSVYEEAAKRVPVVFMGRYLPVCNAHSIESDNVGGAYDALNHLIQLGHRRIALLNGIQNISTSVGRWHGVQKAVEENGLDWDELIVRFIPNTIEGGYDEMMSIIQKEKSLPTAVYTDNNSIAAGVIKACEEARVLIPQRISLSSYDAFADMQLGELIQPHVTANIHPTAEIARLATEMICEACRDPEAWERMPKHTVVPNRFVIGDSTAPLVQK